MASDSEIAIEDVRDLDFAVEQLGVPELPSPVRNADFVAPAARITLCRDADAIERFVRGGGRLPAFEKAGPRERIYHDPAWTRVAIVTCGGLCPGINDVIRSLVNTLYFDYGVDNVFGIRYGFRGLVPAYGLEPVALDPEKVDLIHEHGGSLLGSSRGSQDVEEMVRTLDRLRINVLFAIGGDGTQRGAAEIAAAARHHNLPISVIGVPKTIDNDLSFVDRSFGFETAVYAAAPVISCAHAEAKGAHDGIGLVKLMGRESGFIAAAATLANSVVNFCLIPESPFTMDGPGGLLAAIERRLAMNDHAVIVVAEGAGQDLLQAGGQHDASGNAVLSDIGVYLRDRISAHLRGRRIDHAIKYIDPSYIIRSVPARGTDAIFCLQLAGNAVHAAMAGKTGIVVGHWAEHFVHVPMALAVRERRKVNLKGQLWQSVLSATQQQRYFA
ncbi:MAG: Pyrophosphate--fructose 6-phosphate 1-phosphotransferase [Lentisphaerae bacterium ADurb.BinA184]|nr:MAG: Pyrophosphate--fructose 6-phosphate 1-phosphotransferase [Lentisphaerae bacterium ADurb.BinA184]